MLLLKHERCHRVYVTVTVTALSWPTAECGLGLEGQRRNMTMVMQMMMRGTKMTTMLTLGEATSGVCRSHQRHRHSFSCNSLYSPTPPL